MLKLINTSTAYYGSGLSIQNKLFCVQRGEFAGRMGVIIPVSDNTIKFAYADPPYISWSTPISITSNAADYPPSGWMDENGNIYAAYTVSGSLNLVVRKLSFSNGLWSIGSENTIHELDSNYYPSLYKDLYTRLWVSWTSYTGGNYYIVSKRSVDDGVTWDGGASNPGTILTSGAGSAFSKLVYLPTYVFCFYSEGGTKLACRKYEISGGLWSSEDELFSGTDIDDNFSACVSSDKKVGLVFLSGSNLYFREYDGAVWSGNYNIDNDVSVSPNLKYNGSIPFVFFGKALGGGQDGLLYSFRSGSGFISPERVTCQLAVFEKVLCYNDTTTVRFTDCSSEAANDTGGDVFHLQSNKMVNEKRDALFLGQSKKFHQIKFVLSTPGSGGEVKWYYRSGSGWTEFVPASGVYNFDSTPSLVRLWDDDLSVPSEWQSSVINGHSMYWIKAEVDTDFSTAPVGSQITASADIQYICSLQEG